MSTSVRSEVVCYRVGSRSLEDVFVMLERRGGIALTVALSRHMVGRIILLWVDSIDLRIFAEKDPVCFGC